MNSDNANIDYGMCYILKFDSIPIKLSYVTLQHKALCNNYFQGNRGNSTHKKTYLLPFQIINGTKYGNIEIIDIIVNTDNLEYYQINLCFQNCQF